MEERIEGGVSGKENDLDVSSVYRCMGARRQVQGFAVAHPLDFGLQNIFTKQF